jgi:hypothetical protein
MTTRRRPIPEAVMKRHRQIMSILKFTDADPEIQKAAALVYRSGVGGPFLEFVLDELQTPLYTVGEPVELAIAQAVRHEFSVFLMDLIRRGETALEAGDGVVPPEDHGEHGAAETLDEPARSMARASEVAFTDAEMAV